MSCSVLRAAFTGVSFLSMTWLCLPVLADEPSVKSPKKVVEEFNAAIAAKAKDRALAVTFPVSSRDFKEMANQLVDAMLTKRAGLAEIILDEKAIGDFAIVVVGIEGKNFRAGIDIDAVVVARHDGEWRVVAAPVPQIAFEILLASGTDKEKAKEPLMQLAQWYAERKQEIYSEREAKSAAPPK